MAITSLDQYIAARKDMVLQKKTASMTSVAQIWFSPFAQSGIPGAGTLNPSNTANGTVPDDTVAGHPLIDSFAGSNGYISRINGYSSVAGQIMLADVLFRAGAYSYNSDVTLASQPAYTGRVPNSNYKGLEIWLEAVTAHSTNQSMRILYNDAGDTERDTGVIATGVAPILGRMYRMPLVAAGNGVKRINRVIASGSTAGTFNVLVIRPLQYMRIPFAGYSESRDLYGTGMPQIYDTSALEVFVRADGTASGLPEWDIEIAVG